MTVELIRRLGGSATDAILDSATTHFTVPGVEGLIGYRKENGLAVVFGDPICQPDAWDRLVIPFHKEMEKVIYILASASFKEWALSHGLLGAIEFGEELYFDPFDNPKRRTGTQASLVRRKVRHATAEGVMVEEYLGGNPLLEQQMEQVGEKWVKGRKGPQIHISGIELFSHREGRRWFYAKKGDELVGVILLGSLQKGWLMNHLMITKEAPHGTPELLVTSALEAIEKEGGHFVTVGAVPYPNLGSIDGFSPVARLLARGGFKFFKLLFRLGGRKKFWEKFHPHSAPLYLLFSDDTIGLKEIRSLLRSMHGLS